MEVDPFVLLAAGLLAGGVLVAGLSQRISVPGSLLFLLLGMLAGDGGLSLIVFNDPELARNLGVVALIVILFEGGLTTKPSDLRRAAGPGLALATVGVLITAGVTGGVVYLLLDVAPLTAALVGAVVASTDAAAVFDMLRRAPLSAKLSAILKVESGANDPVAIALTIGLLAVWEGTATGAGLVLFAVLQLVGGVLAGALVGIGGALLLRHARLGSDALYPVLAFAVAGLAYGTAVQVQASGFLAVYVAGLFVGGMVPRRRRGIQGFHAGLATASDIGLFLLLGLLVSPARLPGVLLPAMAVVGVLTLLARPLAVVLTVGWARDIGVRAVTVLSWAGLRGAVPIVLSTFPFTAGHPEGQAIFDVVFFVVLVSTLVQGVTVAPLVRALGIAAERPGWAPVAEALPLEGVDVDLVEVTVTPDLSIADRRLRDTGMIPGLLVVAVVRDDHLVVPSGQTTLHVGDLVVLAVQPQEEAAERATAWARGELRPDPPGDDG